MKWLEKMRDKLADQWMKLVYMNEYQYFIMKKSRKVPDFIVIKSYYHTLRHYGDIYHYKMTSGKMGIYQCIKLARQNSNGYYVEMDFVGYLNEKPIRECTFEEFLHIYKNYRIGAIS